MKRVLVGVGKALRDTGQAVERMGMRAQDNWIFQEKICRHRALMNLFDQRPKLRPSVFVAPNASLVGNVSVMDESSIWRGRRALAPRRRRPLRPLPSPLTRRPHTSIPSRPRPLLTPPTS